MIKTEMFAILKHDVDKDPVDDISLEDMEDARKKIQNELRPVCTKCHTEICVTSFCSSGFLFSDSIIGRTC